MGESGVGGRGVGVRGANGQRSGVWMRGIGVLAGADGGQKKGDGDKVGPLTKTGEIRQTEGGDTGRGTGDG